MREWAFAQVDVVDEEAINPVFTGATNNSGVVRNIITTTRAHDSKKVTIRFYVHSAGAAYVYHRPDQTESERPRGEDPDELEVTTRRSASEKDISLAKLEGNTAIVNAPDTSKAYEMDSTKVFSRATTPLELFDSIPSGTDHVVVSSHGVEVGGNVCMFVGGVKASSKFDWGLQLYGCLQETEGKVSANCVVWLGGCASDRIMSFARWRRRRPNARSSPPAIF